MIKPFDLEKCIAGEPVIFRNGGEYRFAGYNPDALKNDKIIGWDVAIGDSVTHDENGFFNAGMPGSSFDLFMKH